MHAMKVTEDVKEINQLDNEKNRIKLIVDLLTRM